MTSLATVLLLLVLMTSSATAGLCCGVLFLVLELMTLPLLLLVARTGLPGVLLLLVFIILALLLLVDAGLCWRVLLLVAIILLLLLLLLLLVVLAREGFVRVGVTWLWGGLLGGLGEARSDKTLMRRLMPSICCLSACPVPIRQTSELVQAIHQVNGDNKTHPQWDSTLWCTAFGCSNV